MELVVNNVEAVPEKKKRFPMLDESVNMQLALHFSNLFTYFSANNELVKNEWDKNLVFNTDEILSSFDFLLCHPQYIEELFLERFMRQILPLEFRVSQLIQAYGPENIKGYINLIYNRKVG